MADKPLIILDADGVMLDYHAAYIKAYENFSGAKPKLVNPNAYWVIDQYDIERLNENDLKRFKANFNKEFWENVPALPGAVEACNMLAEYYRIVCVTAIDPEFSQARYYNLRNLNFNVDFVYGTGHPKSGSPKKDLVNHLRPIAFVDDYICYHEGIDPDIHRALITRENENSPNNDKHNRFTIQVDSEHKDLLEFAKWWFIE